MTKTNEVEARRFYREGMTYYNHENYEPAFDLLKKSADLGYAPAQAILGNMFMNGTATQVDAEKATALWSKAAEQDYAPAQCYLAICYITGCGTKEDESLGVYWLEKSIAQNYVEAYIKLSYFYFQKGDKEKAYDLLEEAVSLGSVSAKEILIKLKEDENRKGHMFTLDEKFLEELGLSELTNDEKDELLQSVYKEVESRTGERLTEGLSDDELDEFGCFVDHNELGMNGWFERNLPEYKEREDYQQFCMINQEASELAILSQYGAMQWLKLNIPEYPQIVSVVLEEMKQELRDNSETILENARLLRESEKK